MSEKESLPAGIEQKIAGYLGLAQKAGRIAAGDAATLSALAAGKASLVVMAMDAAVKVQEEVSGLAAKKHVPLIYWRDKDSLGIVIGRSRRGAVAVLDEGFANAIIKCIKGLSKPE